MLLFALIALSAQSLAGAPTAPEPVDWPHTPAGAEPALAVGRRVPAPVRPRA